MLVQSERNYLDITFHIVLLLFFHTRLPPDFYYSIQQNQTIIIFIKIMLENPLFFRSLECRHIKWHKSDVISHFQRKNWIAFIYQNTGSHQIIHVVRLYNMLNDERTGKRQNHNRHGEDCNLQTRAFDVGVMSR